MPLATTQDACREYARNVGHDRPTQAWILTDYDTWERNPFYVGPPARHPEDEADDAMHEDAGHERVSDDSTEVPF